MITYPYLNRNKQKKNNKMSTQCILLKSAGRRQQRTKYDSSTYASTNQPTSRTSGYKRCNERIVERLRQQIQVNSIECHVKAYKRRIQKDISIHTNYTLITFASNPNEVIPSE